MPIIIKDYEWQESESHVFVMVPLKGIKSTKVDVISSPKYLKVSFTPYLFECFLYDETDDDASVALFDKGVINFKLRKCEPKIWDQLQITDIKNCAKDIRNHAMVYYREKLEKKAKEKEENKRKNEKYTLNEMMKIENCDKIRIQNVKESERQKANEELEAWKDEELRRAEMEKQRILEERKWNRSIAKVELAESKMTVNREPMKENGIFKESERSTSDATRSVGTIEVNFTPRVFPTPVRESVTPQEEEWLKKQAEMRKVREALDADLTDEERNPVWLRDKGNKFFASGDYQAAINAYSQAIRLKSHMPSLYSNRAACHMKLGNYVKCIEDSSKAIDFLTPAVPQNVVSRCKGHVRRGTAFCQLELYVEGLHDYEAALKLDPSNEKLKEDAEKIRRVIQGSNDGV